MRENNVWFSSISLICYQYRLISGLVLFEEQLDVLMSNRTHLLLKFLQLVCEYDVDYMFSENPRPSVTWTSLWESITDFLPIWPHPSWRMNSYLRCVCPTPQLSLAKTSWMRQRVNSTRLKARLLCDSRKTAEQKVRCLSTLAARTHPHPLS